MKPREFFPNMPDEVFNNWLAPHIKLYGWPFKNIDENFSHYDWPNCFGIHQTLKQWSECEWKTTKIQPSILNLEQHTIDTIADIISFAVEGIPTFTTDQIGVGSKERFWACASFYSDHGGIPCPIVFYTLHNSVRIIDGFHRLASIFHVGVTPDLTIPAWEAKFK